MHLVSILCQKPAIHNHERGQHPCSVYLRKMLHAGNKKMKRPQSMTCIDIGSPYPRSRTLSGITTALGDFDPFSPSLVHASKDPHVGSSLFLTKREPSRAPEDHSIVISTCIELLPVAIFQGKAFSPHGAESCQSFTTQFMSGTRHLCRIQAL